MKSHSLVIGIGLLFAMFANVGVAPAEVKVALIFASHMVLQREMPVPVWGTADAGNPVTVTFAGQRKTATADANGAWRVTLDAMTASDTPDVMTVTSAATTLRFEDVLVGEVWLGSGQSPNIAGHVNGCGKDDAELQTIARQTHAMVRAANTAWRWKVLSEQSSAGCSPLMTAFAVSLQKELNVPVGMIIATKGGMSTCRFLTEEMLQADETCRQKLQQIRSLFTPEQQAHLNAARSKALEKYESDLAAWKVLPDDQKNPPTKSGRRAPRKPWNPAPWEPDAESGWGDAFDQQVKPNAGYAIRGIVWDQGKWESGLGDVDQYTMMRATISGWRSAWKQAGGNDDFALLYVQKPTGGGCAFAGDDPVTAAADKFADLPAQMPAPGEGIQRETNNRLAALARTTVVTASDLGDELLGNVKMSYGRRVTRVALGFVYRQPGEHIGPVYAGHEIDGDKIKIRFTHRGDGLVFRGGQTLQGFAIAGEDRIFHWSEAIIDGDQVIVSSTKVPRPRAVRYAWGATHPWANLFSKSGLPAMEFRTDTW